MSAIDKRHIYRYNRVIPAKGEKSLMAVKKKEPISKNTLADEEEATAKPIVLFSKPVELTKKELDYIRSYRFASTKPLSPEILEAIENYKRLKSERIP
jgi:hypothetical protein